MLDWREKKPRRVAIKFCASVITFAIGIAVYWAWTAVPRPSTTREHPIQVNVANYPEAEPGTLKRDIQDAKARGESTVELSVIGCGSDIGSLQAALSRDTVVVADLVDKKTYADTFGLRTWYRFKTREILVEHPYPRHSPFSFADAPSDMLPIGEDEFLIQEANGQMEIDGVTVKQYSNGPRYREGQTYLLFLTMDTSKRRAFRSGTDPLGVFLVDSNGNLTPYLDEPYSFGTQLAKRFNNSLANMRQALEKK
jgi:hypothetical protein